MHSGAINVETAFPTKRIVDRPGDLSSKRETLNDHPGEDERDVVDLPRCMTEESMEPTPMPLADVAAGENDVGDKSTTRRDDPTYNDLCECIKCRNGENRSESA